MSTKSTGFSDMSIFDQFFDRSAVYVDRIDMSVMRLGKYGFSRY